MATAPPRRAPVVRVQFPTAIEAAYSRKLQARTAQVHALVVRHLGPLLRRRAAAEAKAAAAEKADRADAGEEPTLEEFLRVLEKVRVAYTAAAAPPESSLAATARQLDLFTSGQVARVVKGVAAIDIGRQPKLESLYRTWTAGNVDLIKSIDAQHFDQIRDVIYDGVKRGVSTDQLTAHIAERYGVARSRARLIARDQVGKLNGEITMQRQVSVGVKRYRWMTSHDERVRPEHRALDGKVFSWDSPPPEGHPGYPVQCRCSAIPIWEEDKGDSADRRDSRIRPAPPPEVPSHAAEATPDALPFLAETVAWFALLTPSQIDGWDGAIAVPFPCTGYGVHPDVSDRQVPLYTTRGAIAVDQLSATQPGVGKAKVLAYLRAGSAQRLSPAGDREVPLVARLEGGRIAILDGHHRLSAAAWAGAKLVTVDLYSGPLALDVVSSPA